jgi:hypothetical protein
MSNGPVVSGLLGITVYFCHPRHFCGGILLPVFEILKGIQFRTFS